MEIITSRQNPLCTHLRKLAASASYRRQRGEFLCDSPKLLKEALLWGAEVRTVVATAGVDLPELPLGVRQVEVPADVMKSVSPMDSLQDPGYVGTILRTADAFPADGMFLVNGCADLYNPKTLRATMGAVFRCPVWTVGAEELSALLKKSSIPLYGAALREDTLDARAVDYNRCAIAIGSEGRGLTEGVLALCDRTIKIPMSEHCESLNAAAAATVLLWEAARND